MTTRYIIENVNIAGLAFPAQGGNQAKKPFCLLGKYVSDDFGDSTDNIDRARVYDDLRTVTIACKEFQTRFAANSEFWHRIGYYYKDAQARSKFVPVYQVVPVTVEIKRIV